MPKSFYDLKSRNDIHDWDLPDDYEHLTDEKKAFLCEWVSDNFIARKTPNRSHTSYGLKHYFEHDRGGFYITNGQFKGAMLRCDFYPADEGAKNWVFCISQKSPVFQKGIMPI